VDIGRSNGTLHATHILTKTKRLTSLKTQNSNERGGRGRKADTMDVLSERARDREGGRDERGWGGRKAEASLSAWRASGAGISCA
jgi:hypothetical protein